MRTKTPDLDQRILDAAAQLFAGNHFHSVRMEDISSQADVGKGTLYRYFHDKEELYLALLGRAANQMRERVRLVAAQAIEPFEKLVALIDSVVTFFDEQRHIFELIAQAESSRGVNHPWQAARDAIIVEVVALLEEGQRLGLFVVPEPMITALVLLGGLRAVIRFGPSEKPKNFARFLVGMVLFGAAAPLEHVR